MELGTSPKGLLAGVMAVLAVFAAIVWVDDRPDAMVWTLRSLSTGAVVVLLILILKLHFRTDIVPDYLRPIGTNYFNRGGFAFLPSAARLEESCWLTLTFQNQRAAPCIGRVRLRPARGFFLMRNAVDEVIFEVFCEPAAFGIARIPIGLAQQFQGTHQRFEVGASVEYFDGKGRLVRFWDGNRIEMEIELRRSPLSFPATFLGMFAGHFISPQKPNEVTIELPAEVSEMAPINSEQVSATLWRLNDPPLSTNWRVAND